MIRKVLAQNPPFGKLPLADGVCLRVTQKSGGVKRYPRIARVSLEFLEETRHIGCAYSIVRGSFISFPVGKARNHL
ncbi:hypothetical protein [Treponema endosymbiont of Eucomonympha sp.]|uniref:hypothetical protein n=1 Tax=Treponema endosymbiont of Eucomonympha sp. TaxID=1580831 RepID=UPI00075110F2|nr:hypothetical protein [Treponema endosymbiont of Eucomonympha sp.]